MNVVKNTGTSHQSGMSNSLSLMKRSGKTCIRVSKAPSNDFVAANTTWCNDYTDNDRNVKILGLGV